MVRVDYDIYVPKLIFKYLSVYKYVCCVIVTHLYYWHHDPALYNYVNLTLKTDNLKLVLTVLLNSC